MRTIPLTIVAAALLGSTGAYAQVNSTVLTSARVHAHAGRPPSTFHVVNTFRLPGADGWDYLNVDGAAHRLYISRGTHVMVMDTRTGALAGDIPNTPGVHGIALDGKLYKGFISDGGDNTVTVFDTRSLKVLDRIKVGTRPDCIIFDPGSNRVFTFNGGSNDSTAVDPAADKVVGTVPLDGRPEYAASNGRGGIFCNIEDKSEICAIDSIALRVKSVWPIAPGDGPSGLAIDAAHNRLFSVCENHKMIVLDADTGKVLAVPEIGGRPDACGFDPGLGLAFSSNGDGTLTVVREQNPDTFSVADTVKTEPGARTLAVDSRAHTIYLCTAKPDPTPPPAGAPRFRRRYLDGTFVVLVVSR